MPFTRFQRKSVECNFCHHTCCASCLQQYLLTLQADAQCMSCRHAFDGEFLAMHLSKSWLLGAYKTHREKVLLDREMAFLPASQDMLAIYREAAALREELIEMEVERQALLLRAQELSVDMARARGQVEAMRMSNYTRRPQGLASAAGPESGARRQFIRACPVENCRGFLSTAWKCGTCDARVCKDCGEPKLPGQHGREDGEGSEGSEGSEGEQQHAEREQHAEHVCNPDIAASHALLQRDSRPCPGCASMIFKLEGCDQVAGYNAGRRALWLDDGHFG